MGIFERALLLKKGDVKISSEDLVTLFQILENYQCIVCNNLDMLNDEERVELDKNIETYDFMKVKYILIADCRRQEHLWYELLKMIENGKYEKYDGVFDDIEEYSLEEYMKMIENLILRNQELTPNIKVLIGMLIELFSFDEVKRCVWGYYLRIKAERERLKGIIERPHGEGETS